MKVFFNENSLNFFYHSFVPASQAEIGITDKLFTRIKTTETVSQVKLPSLLLDCYLFAYIFTCSHKVRLHLIYNNFKEP